MQLLYVVDLTVEGDEAFDRILNHVATWVGGREGRLHTSDFMSSGNRELDSASTPSGRHARNGEWETIATAGERALKLVIHEAIDADLELRTRVTVAQLAGEVRFRIGIARETTNSRLIPVGSTDLYQPGILRSLDLDPELTLRAAGQLINRRYIPVRSAAEAAAVAEILPSTERLPLAFVHVRSTKTWDLARELSQKLLGLVRTVTVNFETARIIAEQYPGAQVPFDGLAIVWPGLGAPSLTLSSERLAELEVSEVRLALIRRLGALAALTQGEDSAWRRVRSAVDDARLHELSAEADRARAGGDTDGQILALHSQISTLRVAKLELEEIGEEALQQAEDSAQQSRLLEANLSQARDEALMWRNAYLSLSSGQDIPPVEPEDIWSSVPTLESHVDPEATFLAISDAASERIVFTKRARRSWAGINYPQPDDMTEKLIHLAKASVTLYDGEAKNLPPMDEWMKNQFGLSVALTDQTISRWKRKEMRWLNNFEHEGVYLDATPHIKVRDAVKFNECGRIHFAFDAKNARVVVQHVGIKTYE